MRPLRKINLWVKWMTVERPLTTALVLFALLIIFILLMLYVFVLTVGGLELPK